MWRGLASTVSSARLTDRGGRCCWRYFWATLGDTLQQAKASSAWHHRLMGWSLTFWADADDREPVKDWLDGLDPVNQAAAIRGLSCVLGDLGPDVCKSEYGKPLGDGLYEFRLRHSAKEIISRYCPEVLDKLKLPPPDGSVLLRVFFHPHGDQLILLLGGYDKGRYPGDGRQQREIALARKRLATWKREQGIGRTQESNFRPWWAKNVNQLRK